MVACTVLHPLLQPPSGAGPDWEEKRRRGLEQCTNAMAGPPPTCDPDAGVCFCVEDGTRPGCSRTTREPSGPQALQLLGIDARVEGGEAGVQPPMLQLLLEDASKSLTRSMALGVVETALHAASNTVVLQALLAEADGLFIRSMACEMVDTAIRDALAREDARMREEKLTAAQAFSDAVARSKLARSQQTAQAQAALSAVRAERRALDWQRVQSRWVHKYMGV